ncbi:MAG TPA: hypothetical protein VGB08_00150 [Allosphingosinicella sp.]|jgi:hypothetical protein
MRAAIALAAAALLLSGCETAFVGRAPDGRYALVEVNGRPLPHAVDSAGTCRIDRGHFDLDSLARRFEMVLDQSGACPRAGAATIERGTYLRRGGRLELEAAAPGGEARALVASESGGTIAMGYDGLRLRFRRVPAPAR